MHRGPLHAARGVADAAITTERYRSYVRAKVAGHGWPLVAVARERGDTASIVPYGETRRRRVQIGWGTATDMAEVIE